jgi:hypothetical protein
MVMMVMITVIAMVIAMLIVMLVVKVILGAGPLGSGGNRVTTRLRDVITVTLYRHTEQTNSHTSKHKRQCK